MGERNEEEEGGRGGRGGEEAGGRKERITPALCLGLRRASGKGPEERCTRRHAGISSTDTAHNVNINNNNNSSMRFRDVRKP